MNKCKIIFVCICILFTVTFANDAVSQTENSSEENIDSQNSTQTKCQESDERECQIDYSNSNESDPLDSHEAMNTRDYKARNKRSAELDKKAFRNMLLGIVHKKSVDMKQDDSSDDSHTPKFGSDASELLLELMVRIAAHPAQWDEVHEVLQKIDSDIMTSKKILCELQDNTESTTTPTSTTHEDTPPTKQPAESTTPREENVNEVQKLIILLDNENEYQRLKNTSKPWLKQETSTSVSTPKEVVTPYEAYLNDEEVARNEKSENWKIQSVENIKKDTWKNKPEKWMASTWNQKVEGKSQNQEEFERSQPQKEVRRSETQNQMRIYENKNGMERDQLQDELERSQVGRPQQQEDFRRPQALYELGRRQDNYELGRPQHHEELEIPQDQDEFGKPQTQEELKNPQDEEELRKPQVHDKLETFQRQDEMRRYYPQNELRKSQMEIGDIQNKNHLEKLQNNNMRVQSERASSKINNQAIGAEVEDQIMRSHSQEQVLGSWTRLHDNFPEKQEAWNKTPELWKPNVEPWSTKSDETWKQATPEDTWNEKLNNWSQKLPLNKNSTKEFEFAYHRVTGLPLPYRSAYDKTRARNAYIAVSVIAPKASDVRLEKQDQVLEDELHQLKPWSHQDNLNKMENIRKKWFMQAKKPMAGGGEEEHP